MFQTGTNDVKLAQWRKLKALTQGELADALGCSQPYVSQIERATDPIIPGPALMISIFDVTAGAVQPNDFYELPRVQPERAAA